MKSRIEFLQKLVEYLRDYDFSGLPKIRWEDGKAIRNLTQRFLRGEDAAWDEFLNLLRSDDKLSWEIYRWLEDTGLAETTVAPRTGKLSYAIPYSGLDESDQAVLLQVIFDKPRKDDERPKKAQLSKVMYIEEKPGLAGHARIGRVTFSASRKTIYYQGRRLQTLRGEGYKANYVNLESGLKYWISNCKKDGNDTLYPGLIEIDEDAREEYWLSIRNKPENVHLTKIRSLGKYSKRRPS